MQRLPGFKWMALVILACLTSGPPAVAANVPTLADFGFGRLAADAHVAESRPLLIIVADFTNGTSTINTTLDTNRWDNFAFVNSTTSNTLNGFFGENSSNRFQWRRGGTVKVELDEYYLYKNVNARVSLTNGHDTDIVWSTEIVRRAMELYDFKQHDANTNGTMDKWELAILIVHDDSGIGGANRHAGPVTDTRATVVWDGSIAAVPYNNSAGVFFHELGHILGADDFYGIWGQDGMHEYLTAMHSGIDHFDAWNKFRWGWIEPRIFSMSNSGVTQLWAAQMGRTDSPIILYDETRGTNEFFLLEYRTKQSPAGGLYETDLADDGLLIWHVYQDAAGKVTWLADAMYPNADKDWYRCDNCQMLIKRGFTHNCPGSVTGFHDCSLAENSVVMNDPSAPGEKGWSLCHKCGGLYCQRYVTDSVCPAGGNHGGPDSGNFTLTPNAPGVWGMKYYYRCGKCQALFFGYRLDPAAVLTSNGVCPDGGAHEAAGAPYTIPARWQITSVISEAKLSATDLTFCPGENNLWKVGERTPFLCWFDRAETAVQLYVQSARSSDGSLTVRWISGTWVDFHYVGDLEDGSFEYPFNTFAEGADAVTPGAALRIKSGISSETARVTKAMSIRSFGGPVTIGRR